MIARNGIFALAAGLALVAAGAAQAGARSALPEGSFQVAQSADPGTYGLEEQVRDLNGKVEELSYQLLQLEEKIRKMQEDNEFRFQQLEGGGGQPPADSGTTNSGAAEPMEVPDPSASASSEDRPVTIIQDENSAQAGAGPSTKPRDLGTLTLDEKGDVKGGSIDFSKQGVDKAIDGNAVASVANTDDPDALYSKGYEDVMNGDYAEAESIFRTFGELYPNKALAKDAEFWLAESVRAQGRLQEAAKIFIDHQKAYPDSKKAPETLFKIGQIMDELGNRDLACVTFADAEQKYPDMSQSVRDRLRDARLKAKC